MHLGVRGRLHCGRSAGRHVNTTTLLDSCVHGWMQAACGLPTLSRRPGPGQVARWLGAGVTGCAVVVRGAIAPLRLHQDV